MHRYQSRLVQKCDVFNCYLKPLTYLNELKTYKLIFPFHTGLKESRTTLVVLETVGLDARYKIAYESTDPSVERGFKAFVAIFSTYNEKDGGCLIWTASTISLNFSHENLNICCK